MTESERKKIADLLESGMTIGQIRQLMAMTSAEFTRAIAEMKRNGELPKRKFGKERIAEAMARGETNPYELADMYGVSYGYVNLVFHRHKVARPKKNWKHSDRTNAIAEDLKEGVLTQYQIAKKHGVNRQWVYQVAKKLERTDEK